MDQTQLEINDGVKFRKDVKEIDSVKYCQKGKKNQKATPRVSDARLHFSRIRNALLFMLQKGWYYELP